MPAAVHDLTVPFTDAGRAARRAADAWGAEFDPPYDPERPDDGPATGPWTLHLPVVAGLRRGVESGRLELERTSGGSRIRFSPEASSYSLHAASVVVLAFSALGALLAVLWPFFPGLIQVAPFGVILALGGWFLVLNRLRNAGPEEFLKAVELEAKGLQEKDEDGEKASPESESPREE